MIGIFWPLAMVAGSFSRVIRLGVERMRTRFSPSRAWREMSRARFDASQPNARPNRLPLVNGALTGADGKFAAVDGGTAGVASPPRTALGPAPPLTLVIGELGPARA